MNSIKRKLTVCVGIVVMLLNNYAAAQTQSYRITSTANQYSYLSSGFTPILGCQPNETQCDFGVTGTFDFTRGVFDQGVEIGVIDNVSLQLIGNESIQENPPTAALVTAARVANLFADIEQRALPVLGPFDLFASEDLDLQLTVFGDIVTLFAERDARPVDGDGFRLDLTAFVVPEPTSLALLAIGFLGLTMGPRYRFN